MLDTIKQVIQKFRMDQSKKNMEEWKKYNFLDKIKFIFEIIDVILGLIIAIVGCYYAKLQTNIYRQQEEIARRQTQPEIVLDISYDKGEYYIEFESLQGIVYNANLDIYTCIIATIYDFSSVTFNDKKEEQNFNPHDYYFNSDEFVERTIILPIRSVGAFTDKTIGNSTKRRNMLLSCTINDSAMKRIEESANFDISVDNNNKHWVFFSEAGVFFRLNYQDIYGEEHQEYFLLVPELLYNGIYKVNDKIGEFIYNDCYEVMGKITTHDCLPLGEIDLDIVYITDEIAKREIRKRYKKYIRFSDEEKIPVFYTYYID